MAFDQLEWLYSVKLDTIDFLNNMKSKSNSGFYNYSASGDIFCEKDGWGLGNTVFAVKIMHTIGQIGTMAVKEKEALYNFISSFQRKDGSITDPLIIHNRKLNSLKDALKTLNFRNISSKNTIRAETRQSMSALRLLGKNPPNMFSSIPYTSKGIEQYLSKLNWCDPWSAGSHFSHLLFFYKYNSTIFGFKKNKSKELIEHAVEYVNKMQSHTDGVWYKGRNTSMQYKVNGAMKILTGFKAAGLKELSFPEKIIDLALSAENDSHACDNFNIVFILKYANEIMQGSYRLQNIKDFCFRRLSIYKEYYHSENGGFSFFRKHCNKIYYGAHITKGLDEPDIHATCLFLWGISLIVQILEVQEELDFKEFIA